MEKNNEQKSVEQPEIISALLNAAKYGYGYHRTTQFPELSFNENCRNNFLQFIQPLNYEQKFHTSATEGKDELFRNFIRENSLSSKWEKYLSKQPNF